MGDAGLALSEGDTLMRRFGMLIGFPAALACNAVLGVDRLAGDAGSDAPASAWLEHASAACGACASTSCASPIDDCTSEACRSVHACLARCAALDWRCRADCEATDPDALDDEAARALDRCVRTRCTDECLGIGGLVDGLGSPECSACFDSTCEFDTLKCLLSDGASADSLVGGCEREWACIRGADVIDPARRLECTDGYWHPSDVRSNFHGCRNASCSAECDFGTEWACLEAYEWPAPTTQTVSYDLYIRDGIKLPVTFSTLRGIRVTACAEATCASCAPVDTSVTDEDEEPATLDLPMTGDGFRGCFQLEQDPVANREPTEFAPTVHYFGRPITKHEGRVTITMLPALPDVKLLGGLPLEDGHGLVYAMIHDCRGDRARRVRFEIDGPGDLALPYFMQSDVSPRLDFTETNAMGIGGFINIVPGRYEVRAVFEDQVVSRQVVDVIADTVTQIWMYPTPG